MGMPVVFNLGMGVDSAAALVELLENPARRDFDLADLVVVTSQTGDEFRSTGRLVETHLLPLLRAHGVRFVELGRAAATVKAAGTGHNYVVLQDTRSPERLHIEGGYKLSTEMLAAGTMPTTAGDRKCSLKAKGEVIDDWITTELLSHPDAPFRQMIGYESNEADRVKKDAAADAERKAAVLAARAKADAKAAGRVGKKSRKSKATGPKGPAKPTLLGRIGEFPLVAWNWDRKACQDYLMARFGVTWLKSCCVYCPFSKGRPEILARFRESPDEAVLGLWIEYVSMALNPRLKLYGDVKGIKDVLTRDGNAAALALFESRLAATEGDWVVYRVRRLYKNVNQADRHIGVVARGTRAEAEAAVGRLAVERGSVPEEDADGYVRAYLIRRAEKPKPKRTRPGDPPPPKAKYEAVEEMLVAAPRVAVEKAARGWAEEKWAARVPLAMATAGAGDGADEGAESPCF